jgi:pimeloyl-ACP methyl ester carboxylesterase
MSSSFASSPVILVHGLWMGGWAMSWLAHELRQAGFEPDSLSYESVRGTLEEHVARLRQCIEQLSAQHGRAPIHLIGHSMGGVVVLRALAEEALARQAGRVVLLGTPARGSQAARAFEAQPWGSALLGHSRELWRSPFPCVIAPSLEVAAIAGDEPFGLGPLFVSLPSPSDGVVTVEETRIDGLRDHRVLHVSHTGMLVSREVAQFSATFIRTGRFPG